MIKHSIRVYFTILGLLFFASVQAQIIPSNKAEVDRSRPLFNFKPDGSIKINGVIGHNDELVGHKHKDEHTPLMVASLPKESVIKDCSFFGGDSLSGFDFEKAFNQAEIEGDKMYSEFRVFMFRTQAEFIKKKYRIKALPFEVYHNNNRIVVPQNPSGAACVNMDFENGDFTNWVGASGDNTNSNAVLNALGTAAYNINLPITDCADLQMISSAYGNDPISGVVGLDPTGGNWSVRIGGEYINEAAGYLGCNGYHWSAIYSNGEYISQTFTVTAANALISFDYAVVLNDGGHPNGQQPYFHAYVTNSGGAILSTCTEYSVQATAGVPPPGFYNTGFTNGGGAFYAKGWTSSSMNLTPYIGQAVTLYFVSAGCTQGGHPAWAYIDGTCGPAQIIVGNATPCSGTTTILTAPAVTGGAFSWSGPGIVGSTTGQSITVNATGTYTCTVTPSQGPGCAYTLTQSVTFVTSPTAAPTAAPSTLCSGNSTTLNANATNATSYSWSPGGSSASSVVVSPGVGTTVYTLTVTNGGLCPVVKNVSVTVTATPTVNISGNLNICSGSSTTLTGATASSYSWSVGSTSASISVSPSSTTTYTLVGSNGTCSTTAVATVTVTPTPTLTISGTTAICSGASTVLTGATASNYTWNPGSINTNTISVNPNSTTTYTLTGANGVCASTKTVSVVVTATPTLTISGNTAICSGASTVLTGATATNYTWSTGANTNTITVTPPAGTTTYTLTGANGACVSTKTVSVVVTATPTLTISGTTNLCSGQSTVLTGATATNYTWSTGANTNTITVTPPAGTTTYTLTGANGACVSTKTVSVVVTATPTLTISGTTNLCSGQSTVLTGATASNYTWSTGPNTNTVTVTPGVGSTSYTLTGANGTCTSTAVATVSVTATPTVNISGASPICSGQSIVLTGATASNYTWSPGGVTTNTISVNPNSTTTYTLTGANGTCTATALASVSVTPTPTLTISGVTPICNGQTIVLTGATAGSYTWSSGGVTTNTISVNPTSNTTYTLTGANGSCTASIAATVTVNPLPVIGTASITPAPCGQNTGCINNVPVSGGTPAYQYSWDNGTIWANNSTNCNVPSGSYTLEVKDANGCTATQNITVSSQNGPPAPQVAPTSTATCLGDSVVLNINPVQPGITYTWTDITGTHTGTSYTIANISPAGNYNVSVTATDANGCLSTSTDFTITVNSLPSSSVTGTVHFCKGTGTVLNASPSGAGYGYQWTHNGTVVTGATASSYTATSAGNYGVIITDNSTGCKAPSTGNYIVKVDSLPKIDTSNIVITNSNCGQSTGSVINVTVTPNSSTNSYSWTNSGGTVVGTTINLGNVPAGSYCLLVTDSLSCKNNICGVTINNSSAPPSPTLSTPNNTYCQGQTIAPITVTGTGTFNWYSDPGLTTQIATGPTYTPTVAVTTTVYVTSTNSGCQSVSTPVVITINPNPTNPIITASSYTACQGMPVGPLTANGTGTIIWSTSPTMNPIVHVGSSYSPTGLPVSPPPTVYYLQDTLSTGCKSNASATTVTVSIYPNPTIIGTATIDTAKCGATNGDVLGLSASGGTPAYTYQWINSSGATVGTSANLNNVGPGTYSMIVTDSHQCKDTSNAGYTVIGSNAIHAGFNPSVLAGQAPLNVIFTNASSGANAYGWTFGNGTNSTATNPGTTYTSNGTYTVVLIATNGTCADTASAVIVVDVATSIVIPNIFSPNGDGVNDEFIILCTGMRTLNCDIFNRWGQLVYTLTGPNESWDGKLNNGNHATEGTYYFMLNATGYDGKTYTYQGPITLVK